MTNKARGFTLIEMMMAMAIAGVISVGVFGAMRAQLMSTYQQGRVGETQQMARTAMENILANVAQTGFGMPGQLAFGDNAADNFTGSSPYNTCPNTDVLEVRQRDPRGFWGLASATNSTLVLQTLAIDGETISITTDYPWAKGAWVMAYAPSPSPTLLLHVSAARASSVTAVTLTPADTKPTANATPIAGANAELALVQVARYRLNCSDANHPWLQYEDDVTDVNKDGKVDENDYVPIALDIEDFQVKYIIDADKDGVITASDTEVDALPAANATSNTRSQIKAIRVTIVARSPEDQPDGPLAKPPSVENRDRSGEAADRYVRRVLRDTVILQNRNTRNPDSYMHFSNYWI